MNRKQPTTRTPVVKFHHIENLYETQKEYANKGFTETHRFPEDQYTLMVNPSTMERIRLYDHGLVDGPY